MSDFDLVVTGRVVTADRVIDNGHVAVRDGRVARVGEGAAPQARERHDFGNAYILPGAIDAQVHSNRRRIRRISSGPRAPRRPAASPQSSTCPMMRAFWSAQASA